MSVNKTNNEKEVASTDLLCECGAQPSPDYLKEKESWWCGEPFVKERLFTNILKKIGNYLPGSSNFY